MAKIKSVVNFRALPGVVFSAPIPKPDGSSTPYSQMRVGSDDALPFMVTMARGIEVEHGEDEPEEVVVAIAYRRLLRAVAVATFEEFLAARQMVMDHDSRQASL